jgi:hypothetical protein
MTQDSLTSTDAKMLPITALHTRFLHPFFFQPQSLSAVTEALQQLRHRKRNVWLPVPEPHELYRQELLAIVSDFLFLCDDGECRYLQTPAATANSWFRTTTVVRYPDGTVVPVSLIPGVWIEVFLSAYGVGVLSVGLQPDPRKLSLAALEQGQTKLFNYRLAQRHANTAPTFLIPHLQDDPQRREKLQPSTPPPPADDAPFAERLGALERKARLHRVIVTVVLVSVFVIGWFVYGLTTRTVVPYEASVAPAQHEEQPVSQPLEQPPGLDL